MQNLFARFKGIVTAFIIFIFCGLIASIIVGYFLLALFVFTPSGAISKDILISNGESVTEISQNLVKEQIISSETLFKICSFIPGITSNRSRGINAGIYRFSGNESVCTVARRLYNKEYGVDQVELVVPEGFTVYEIADSLLNLDQKLHTNSFSTSSFIAFINSKIEGEGYLFPDTYQLLPPISNEKVYELLHNEFNIKTTNLKNDALALGKNWNDIIIMASLIEGEANKDADRAIISSIFYNRLNAGIPLQSDAPFKIINGKGSSELTAKDLRNTSLFNTYTTKGLPPKPINNPGLASIKAAIYPQSTSYMFFLTGNDGITRYSNTYAEHLAIKNKYLK